MAGVEIRTVTIMRERLGTADYAPGFLCAWTFMRRDYARTFRRRQLCAGTFRRLDVYAPRLLGVRSKKKFFSKKKFVFQKKFFFKK